LHPLRARGGALRPFKIRNRLMAWVPMGLNLDGAPRADGMNQAGRVARFSAALFLAAALVACAGPGRTSRAPVEERNVAGRTAAPLPSAAASEPAEAVKPPPGAENAGKPGYFT